MLLDKKLEKGKILTKKEVTFTIQFNIFTFYDHRMVEKMLARKSIQKPICLEWHICRRSRIKIPKSSNIFY